MPLRQASPPTNLTSPQDFWTAMVVPDCEDYRNNIASLRHAVHSAVSLFHLHDWVFQTDPSTATTFAYVDKSGIPRPVSKASHFANYLEQSCPEFGLIRGVANAAKHLALTHPSFVPNSPTHAANTQVQSTGYGVGGFGAGAYGGGPRVVIEALPANREYLDVMNAVFAMWQSLKATHGW